MLTTKIIKILFIFSLFLLLSSCLETFTQKEISGIYTPIGYTNSLDTIQFQENYTYHRKVYDINGKLLLNKQGKWSFVSGGKRQIQFKSFFLNLDRDLVKFPELVHNTDGMMINIERKNGSIEFCTGYFYFDNCYQKISD